MFYWVLLSVFVVVIVKYYTAMEMRKLERRLERVKDDLRLVKEKLQQAQGHFHHVENEEQVFEERFRRMKEVIEDIQIRLTSKEDGRGEDVLVGDSSPPSRSF